jgi:hypothetical protein
VYYLNKSIQITESIFSNQLKLTPDEDIEFLPPICHGRSGRTRHVWSIWNTLSTGNAWVAIRYRNTGRNHPITPHLLLKHKINFNRFTGTLFVSEWRRFQQLSLSKRTEKLSISCLPLPPRN